MRKLVCLLLTLLTVVSLTACGTQSGTTTNADTGGTRDDVVVNLWNEPTTLHSGLAASTYVNHVAHNMLETLVRVDDNGEIIPWLAKSYEFTDDQKGIIFTLRDDVYFHNGEKMTAEDVAFSYTLVMQGGFASTSTSAMVDMVVLNENQVQLNFNCVFGPALLVCTAEYMVIIPKAAYEADPEGFERAPVGTGPYKFVEWNTGVDIKLTRFDDYWGDAPAIKDVTFRILTDDSAATLALESGEIDVHVTLPQTDIARIQANPKLQYDSTLGGSIVRLIFNPNGMFADERLRLAIAHAVDKESVLLGAIDGDGEVVNSLFHPSCTFLDTSYEAPGYDPELAKQLLAEAGYPNGFELTVSCSSNASTSKPMEIIQAQLAAVGIKVNIEKLESSAWFSDIYSTANYDLNIVCFSAGMADSEESYALFRGGEGQNFSGWDDPDLNEAFDRAHFNVDPEIREQAEKDVVRIMGDKAIVVPVYAMNNSIAANAKLQGIKADSFKNYYVADWSWAE